MPGKRLNLVANKDSSEHLCLISISQSIFAPHNLANFVSQLNDIGHIAKASAVYRVFHGAEIKVTASLLWHTSEDLQSCFAILTAAERSFKGTQAILLTYDDMVQLTPQLTVPYPRWLGEAHLLIPAAEIWGDYHHPILQKNLYALAQQFSGQPWGEFFSQGHELLVPASGAKLGAQRR